MRCLPIELMWQVHTRVQIKKTFSQIITWQHKSQVLILFLMQFTDNYALLTTIKTFLKILSFFHEQFYCYKLWVTTDFDDPKICFVNAGMNVQKKMFGFSQNKFFKFNEHQNRYSSFFFSMPCPYSTWAIMAFHSVLSCSGS